MSQQLLRSLTSKGTAQHCSIPGTQQRSLMRSPCQSLLQTLTGRQMGKWPQQKASSSAWELHPLRLLIQLCNHSGCWTVWTQNPQEDLTLLLLVRQATSSSPCSSDCGGKVAQCMLSRLSSMDAAGTDSIVLSSCIWASLCVNEWSHQNVTRMEADLIISCDFQHPPGVGSGNRSRLSSASQAV